MASPVTFRLRCFRGDGPYYVVRIFDTKEAMRQWATTQNPRQASWYRNAEAAVHAYRILRVVNGQRIKGNGWIVFHRHRLGAGIVSHELTHAAFYYLQLWRPQLFRRLQTSRAADECLAWVSGYLVNQFWVTWYKKEAT